MRSALGATRRQIGRPVLIEPLLLALLAPPRACCSGAVVTIAYAFSQGWPAVVPAAALAGAFGAALAIGARAGLYPAARAARLVPMEALRSV